MRTEDLLKQSQSLAARAAEPPAGAAADQPGARGEGAAARAPERGGRAQERGGRAGAPGARGEGRAARADLEVQVRVPREHVARAAHAAQQPADPLRPAAARTPTATSRRKQVEFAKTIHASGNDLLALINDILDLSKIESGTVVVDRRDVRLRRACSATSSARSGTSRKRRARLLRARRSAACRPAMFTDLKRLQQVLKNLLSNAFKFTHAGQRDADDRAARPAAGIRRTRRSTAASEVIAIRGARHRHRHSAATSSRSSSRRSSRPTAAPAASTAAPGWAWRSAASSPGCSAARSASSSVPGSGSTFTLFLPLMYTPPRTMRKSTGERAHVDGARPAHNANAAPAARILEVPPPPIGGVAVGGYAEVARSPTGTGTDPAPVEFDADDEVGDDRHAIVSGDRVLLIVENDVAFARLAARSGARQGVQRHRHDVGRRSAGARRPVLAGRGHARHLLAGHRRLARTRPIQERRPDPAHSGVA